MSASGCLALRVAGVQCLLTRADGGDGSPIQIGQFPHHMGLADVRPVALFVLRDDGQLSMTLTDGYTVARGGTTPLSADEFRGLVTVVHGRRGAELSSEEARHSGGRLWALFPSSIRDFLSGSPPRHLRLMLGDELMDIPWERAFDGRACLGEKFAVARGIVTDREDSEQRCPEPRSDGSLRVLAVSVAESDDRAGSLSALKSACSSADGVDLKIVPRDEVDVGLFQRRIGQCDVVRWWGAECSGLIGQVRLPPLIILNTAAACPPLRIVADVLARVADSGTSVITFHPAECDDAELEMALLQGLADGLTLAEAVRQATDPRRWGAIPLLYGDGLRVLRRTSGAMGGDDSYRQVSALSYDIADSTRMLASLGAESYSELLMSCHRRCAAIVSAHGGLADDAQGDDGVMCYFGFPIAAEDSAMQCVQAALEIVDGASLLGVRLRVGISTGKVAVHGNQPVGVTIHHAARLQARAQPASIVVAEATRQLAKSRFRFELMEAAPELKGIEHPGGMYRVVGELTRDLERAEHAPGLTSFVGREQELLSLRQQWIDSSVGRLQVVLVTGEAGIGKSRLVREFRHEVESEGRNVMEFRCAPDHSTSTFHPVIDYLRRALDLQERDTPKKKLRKLKRGIARVDCGDDASSLIARLLSLPGEEEVGALVYSSEKQRERTLDVLVGWITQIALAVPTCVIVEDMNWIDPSSRELVDRLIAHAGSVPLLVLLTVRSDALQGMELPAAAARIELRGLGPEQARLLVKAASGDVRLPNETVRALAARGDGVPLFIEESTRMVVDEGPGAAAAEATAKLAIPATLQDLLMVRLDRLGPARQIAQIGATIGREFPLALLEAVLAHRRAPIRVDDLRDRIEVLVASGMLVEKGNLPDRLYYFKHALVREAAYQSLWERDRALLHCAIAEVIAQEFPGLADSQPELLAYHFAEARLEAKALQYWELAARRAASRWANDEAISHVKSALALVPRVVAGDERDRTQLRLLLLLASRLVASEGYGSDQVEGVYRHALAIASQLGDNTALGKVHLGLEGFHFMRGDFAEAEKFARAATELVAHSVDPMPRLQARWAVANILFHRGEVAAAVDHMDACLESYEGLEHRPSALQDPRVMCLCYSAWGLWELGYPDRALERAIKVVALADSMNHKFSMGEAYGFRTTVHYFRGEFDAAKVWAESAIRICEDAGFVVWLAHAKVMYGRVLAELGEPDAGVAEMRSAYDLWASTGAMVTRPFYLAMQAEGLAIARRPEEGLALVDQAMELIGSNGERYYEAELLRLRGELLLQQSARAPAAVQEARRWFGQGLQAARDRGMASLALRCAISMARELAAAGEGDAALRLLEPALGALAEGLATADPCRAIDMVNRLRVSALV